MCAADADTLRLLGGLLAAPDEHSRDVLRELAGDCAWLQAALPELEGMSLEEWQAEHARLFVCGHPRTVCPPFESAQLNGMMQGPAAAELAALYRRAGLEPDGAPPDYLGTMLECAAFLSEQPCGLGAELAGELWEAHLGRWLPAFGNRLGEEAGLLLYRLLGSRIAGLVGHG
jgi:TorA maturation chaperone TorD